MKTLNLKIHRNSNVQMKLLKRFLATPGLDVSFEALDEDIAPDFDNEADNKRIEREYNNGNGFAWFCAKVTVTYKGIEGTDYLGCCSYKSERDFKENSGYYVDMINICVDEINKEIIANNNAICKRFQIRQLKNKAESLGFYLIPKTAII